MSFPVRAVLLGLAATSAVALSACSGIAADSPTDAATEEFCAAYLDVSSTATEVAERLADVGTPEDISSEERNGFEVFVEGLDNEGDTPRIEVGSVNVPEDDQADGNAFRVYADQKCSDLTTGGPGAPTGTPSGTPSETGTPSGTPSATPSDTGTP